MLAPIVTARTCCRAAAAVVVDVVDAAQMLEL